MTFIVCEGLDGSGKSRLLAGLAERMRGLGCEPLLLREPGSTALGERVRAILLDPAVGHMDPLTEALLFSASRREMVLREIAPALAAGRPVLLDRYVYSTIAYQGGGGGADPALIERLAHAATDGLTPDLVLLLDLPPDVAASRRTGAPDRMEARDREYFARVREAFLRQARDARCGGRFAVLDASAAPETVLEAAWSRAAPLVRRPSR